MGSNKPKVAPFAYEVTPKMVKEVWDTYIKPGQDAQLSQSVEERTLMAILRWTYVELGGTYNARTSQDSDD